MLPRAPACRRALSRQLHNPSDSIWISEEDVSQAFRRFANVARTSKRHGSFVPGPLESRRRIGKRRMAHLSEATPSPAHNIAALWGSFWSVEEKQPRWEAPTHPMSRRRAATAALPSWLLDWDSTRDAEQTSTTVSTQAQEKNVSCVEEETRAFLLEIRHARRKDIPDICVVYNETIRQKLKLGLVTEHALLQILPEVTDAILTMSPNGRGAKSQCLLFFNALWEGLSSSKVFQPGDLGVPALEKFISLLSEIIVIPGTQALISVIFRSLSKTQLEKMNSSITNQMVSSWVESWGEDCSKSSCRALLLVAEDAVLTAERKTAYARQLDTSRVQGLLSHERITAARSAIQSARLGIISALEKVHKVEHDIMPYRGSIAALVEVLECLPTRVLYTAIESCTKTVKHLTEGIHGRRSPQYCRSWLLVVSRLSKANDATLTTTWRRMEIGRGPHKRSMMGDIILNHWISQGRIAQPALVQNQYDVASSYFQRGSLDVLLYAMSELGEETCNANLKNLFNLLEDAGRYNMVYRMLQNMHDMDMNIYNHTFEPVLNTMSKHNPPFAVKLYGLFRRIHRRASGPKAHKYPAALRWHRMQDFFLAIVNDSRVVPSTVLGILEIPDYVNEGPSYCRTKQTMHKKALADPNHTLHPKKIEAITNVAIAFAHCESRPKRVAFRCVMHCLHHLRRHHAPVTAELSRAIAFSGITRVVAADERVPEERLLWAQGLIEWAEGKEVANEVRRVVTLWNGHKWAQVRKAHRENNVLRVGPID